MTVQLPASGDEPWDAVLNAAITGIDTDLQAWKAKRGVASGYASLGSDGKVPSNQLPASSGGGGGGTVDAGLSGTWYAGRKWYSYGTSITANYHWPNALSALSGMSLVNKAQSSTNLSKQAGGGGIWDQLITTPADAEVITLESINDFRANVLFGTVADPEDVAVSWYGALRAACNWFLTNRPAARVFFITAYGDAYPQAVNGEGPNAQGKHYWHYNNAMKEVCGIYGIPVLDVGAESGLNFHTMSYFTDDMIHPNALGGERYTDYLWSKMRMMSWLYSAPCPPGAQGPVSATGITINQGNVALAPGGTMQLSATIAPSNATNKGMSWNSSDTSKATVNTDGFLTAVALGSSTITVTAADGGFTDAITVTVAIAAVTGVDLTPPTVTIMPSATTQLTATVAPTNAGNKNVTWASSAIQYATVNSTGLVTGVANGASTITVTTVDGGFTDTTVVTVSNVVPATGVDLTPATANVNVASTVQLTASVLPASATNKSVSFQSSNPAMATVNSTGLVTGLAAGAMNVTVTTADGGFTDTTAVTVKGSEWNLVPQVNGFRDNNIAYLDTTVPGNPTHIGCTQGSYGAIIINSIGDNAIEWEVQNGALGGWWVTGGSSTDGNFTAYGDVGGITPAAVGGHGVFTAGSIVIGATSVPAPTAPVLWATGKVYRMGRINSRVKIVRVDPGDVLVPIWDGDLNHPSNVGSSKAAWFANIDLGLLVNAGGGSYSYPINCKTGTWTP